MARVAKSLSWMLFLVMATSFTTSFNGWTRDICNGGHYKCPSFTVLKKIGLTELREYEPTNWVTSHEVRSGGHNVIGPRAYLDGSNADGKPVESGLPEMLIYHDSTQALYKYSTYIYLPNAKNPKPLDPTVTLKSYPKEKFYTRRYYTSGFDEDEAFKNVTADAGVGNYDGYNYYLAEYLHYREIGIRRFYNSGFDEDEAFKMLIADAGLGNFDGNNYFLAEYLHYREIGIRATHDNNFYGYLKSNHSYRI